MNEDGTMARLPELMKMAQEWNLKVISIKDMIEYRLKKESLIEVGEEVDMPTEYGHFRLIPFRQSSNGLEHMALIKENGKKTSLSWSVFTLLALLATFWAASVATAVSNSTRPCR